jgi:hypothetical protein
MDETLTNRTILKQIRFHGSLNPRLWRNDTLRPEVRLKLLEAALAFYHFLDVDSLIVKDIIFTGSNAAYNYTVMSDIDIHLLVDFTNSACPDLATNFFTTKKALWSKTYDATVRSHAIELYVEDVADPVTANGVYSILRGHWLKIPSRDAPKPDDGAVVHKAQALADEIDGLLDGVPGVADINDMLSRLYVLRQNGLMNGGEFSVENLSFKALRSLGYIDKLHDKRVEIRDEELSLR